jgi:hypothetical protein
MVASYTLAVSKIGPGFTGFGCVPNLAKIWISYLSPDPRSGACPGFARRCKVAEIFKLPFLKGTKIY